MIVLVRFVAVVAVFSLTSMATAVEYSFSRIYTGAACPGVAINDNGLVAFTTGGTTSPEYQLNLTDGVSVKPIQSLDSSMPLQVLSLNNNGLLAFRTAGRSLENRIYVSDGSTASPIAATGSYGGSLYAIGSSAVSINDSGVVVFGAKMTSDSTSSWELLTAGKNSNAVQIGSQKYSDVPSINNAGMVAYRYYNATTGLNSVAIQKGSQVYSFVDAPFIGRAMPDINNLGVVAYVATVGGTQKIVVGSDVLPPTYIDGSLYEGGLTCGFDFDGGMADCAINDQGLVVFMACPKTQGNSGIFVGPDPDADKIIMMGDALGGSTVKSLYFARNGLNNKGEIAFSATLANGTTGIWVATAVPEPSSLVLLAVAIFCLLGYVWRATKKKPGVFDFARQ